MRRVRLGVLVGISVGLWVLFGTAVWALVRTVTYTKQGFTPAEFSIKVGDVVSVINQSQERLILMSLLPKGETTQVGDILAGRTGFIRISGPGTYQLYSGTNPSHMSRVTAQLPPQGVIVGGEQEVEEPASTGGQMGDEVVTLTNQINERYIRPTPIIVSRVEPTRAPKPSLISYVKTRLNIPLSRILLLSAGIIAVVVSTITGYVWWLDVKERKRRHMGAVRRTH